MPTRAERERSLKPGDHAYVAPPFSQRGGSPYLIVRILDLPPTPPGGIPKVKVAYYLRRRDVTNRSLADHRVIFATFMDGVVPLSHVRQKVQVMYRDYLEDPEAFKRQPDSFVFHQIYDRFMHKPFDLIPTSQVMNAPDNILEYLRANYEFVCTELGSASGLCDAMRGCVTCHGFAAKDDSVTCTICSKTWHLGCLEPPLLKKPALGWRWSCIKCTMEQEDDDSDADSAITPNSDRNATRAARRKIKPITTLKNGKMDKGKAPAVRPQLDVAKWKSLNGWPYRYFGEHVHHESVLDPHDPIWPRASTSVGTRFQCLDIPGEEPDPTIKRGPMPKKRRNRKKDKEALPEPERGLDEACEIIWRPDASSSEGTLDELLAPVKIKTVANRQGNVDLIIHALKALHTSSTPEAGRSGITSLLANPPDCPSLSFWSEAEMQLFDEDLEDHEDELGRYTRTRKIKSYPEIVHHYYREKGYQKRFMHLEDPAQDKFAAAGPQGIEAEHGDAAAAIEDEDGNTSVVDDVPSGSGRKARHHCAMCGIDKAEIWYRCPEGLGHQEVTRKERVVCPSCSIQWRHYGSIAPALGDYELDARAAKDVKTKGRGGAASRRSASPSDQKPASEKVYGRLKEQADGSFITIPVKSCVLCKRPEPKASNYECRVCGVACHSGCYGIRDDADPDNWLCDGCEAYDALSAPDPEDLSKRSCYLCNKDLRATGNALDAYKATDNNGLVHLICALWHHELTFQDVDTLRDIENMDVLEEQKFGSDKPSCSICKKDDEGACVKCEACDLHFHVGCAWQAGYRFSFEIRPVKEQWMSRLPRATFKEETGDMQALISCKSHPWTYTRLLYDLGQKDRNTEMTALMTFAHYMKPAETLQKFPLLNTIRCVKLGLQASKRLSASSPLPEDNDFSSLDEIYATKTPYVKPVKQKRKKAVGGKQSQSGRPASSASVGASAANTTKSLSQSKVNGSVVAGHINIAGSKKRKRNKSESSQDASLSTTSEDEVMPTASTSRARGAARPSRGVTLKDLLMDERTLHESVLKGGAVQAKATGSAQASTLAHTLHSKSLLSQNSHPIADPSLQPYASNMSSAGTSYADSEESHNASYPPPWRVLAISSLMHVYHESSPRRQGYIAKSSSPKIQRAASASSAATIPLGTSPRPNLVWRLPPLQYGRSPPPRLPKTESEPELTNGDLANEPTVEQQGSL